MTRFLLRLSSLGAVLVVVGCSANPSTPPGDPNKDGPKTFSTTRAPDLTVTAVDLAREFEANKAAADKRYKGKLLQVEGEVREVLPASGGKTPVLLAGTPSAADGGPGRNIQALFDEKTAGLGGVTPGTKITVTGKCQGDVGFVTLTDCHLGDGARADK